MSVDEALQQYEYFGTHVFGYARWFHERTVLWTPWRSKYSSDRMVEAIMKVTNDKLNRERNPRLTEHEIYNVPFASHESQTRT